MRKQALFKRPGRWIAVLALVGVFFSLSTSAQQTLSGHVPPAIGRFHLQSLGDVPATHRLNLAIDLPLRNQTALGNLIAQIYDPASTNYHHYLTVEQFTEQFGPTGQDYDKVVGFLKANGLTVTGTSPNRMLVDAAGDTATVEKLFHVALHTYQHPTEHRTFFAPDSEPTINLDVPISHISGLDNFVIPRPAVHVHGAAGSRPAGTAPASGSGPGSLYMGKDFRAAYAPGVTLNGAGQTVGLLELEGYLTNDITTYEADAGLSQVTITNILVDSFPGVDFTDTNGIIEVSLDMELEISMATNMNRLAVFEEENGGNIDDILNAIAANGFVKQISSSWLIGDSSSYDSIYKEMAAQGQSFFQASGDDGAFYNGISEWADDTNITLVGGTTLYTTGGSYTSESAWNWLITDPPNPYGTGGGINFNSIPIPSWQLGISMTNNQGSTTLRNVPDVALTADGIYVQATGSGWSVGGTSAAAPLWAGFTALINQQATNYGLAPVGFLNPAIYAIGKSANYTNCFHDVVTGNNTNSTVGNKWYAVPGYDLCTGWGSPNGQNLINALAPLTTPLTITPNSGFAANGFAGGPFTPNSQVYALTNSATSPMSWSLSNTSSWLSVSASGGMLAVGGSTNITISLNTTANGLPVGTYSANILFTNSVTNVLNTLQFSVQAIDPLIITPATSLAASLPAEGTVAPMSQTFWLTNAGTAALTWTTTNSSWLTVSPSSGALAAGAAMTVTASLNATAYSFIAGNYTGQISFQDEPGGTVQNRQFTLAIGQNLVQNGGFETGSFSPWVLNGQGLVDKELYNGVVEASTFAHNVGTNFVHSGTYGAALGQSGYLAYLSQSLLTVPGQTYLLSLWLNNPGGYTPNQFQVNWDTNSATTNTIFNAVNMGAINHWTNMLFVLTATGTNTTLQFGARNDDYYFGLDDVGVYGVPLPNIRGFSKVSTSALSLTWNSLTGLVYQVQYSTNLLSTNWFNLNTNTATGTTLTVTNPIGAHPFLYYRVLRLP